MHCAAAPCTVRRSRLSRCLDSIARCEVRYGRAVSEDPWWRQAVVYQIYPRSFADADGDGLGDLPGITSRVPTSPALGIDAVWLSPFYPSALADGGYDVADYRDVDPRLGTLADFDAMVAALHAAGIRSSSTSCPTTPPTSTRGSRRRSPPGRARRRATATSSATATGPTGRAASDRLGVGLRRLGVGAGRATASGTCTSSPSSSPT